MVAQLLQPPQNPPDMVKARPRVGQNPAGHFAAAKCVLLTTPVSAN